MNCIYNHQLYHVLDQGIFNITSKINVSFEFFPPKFNSIQNSNFLSSIKRLSVFNPDFISITCTTDNSMKNHTYHTIQQVQKLLNLNIAPHITYINSTDDEIKQLARDYWNSGIRNIIALRGDIPKSYNNCVVYASNLVTLLKEVSNFDISVAAYPEIHPDSKNAQDDLVHLKKKIDCGANRAITQFFFDVGSYLRFRDRCAAIGICVEIIPGIMPILDFKQLKKFASMTNVYIPKWIHNLFDGIDPQDTNTNKMLGLAISVNMINQLCAAGVKHFHFYTLNQSDIVYTLCCMLGFKIK